MTWTTIADANLEPGKPARSVDAIALRDNPIAIAKGESGAPRIKTIALEPPVAGNVLVMRFFASDTAEFTTTETAYVPAATGAAMVDAGRHLAVRVVRSGVIRVSLEHRSPSGDSNAWCRILRNGTQVQEWLTASSSYGSRAEDISVVVGDIITFQQKGMGTDPITGGSSGWRNLRISSNEANIAVV